MLGHRTTKGLRLRYYHWPVVAFAVGLFTLVIVAGVSLLAKSTFSHPSSPAPLASSTLDASMAASGLSLDGDVDNDGQDVGMASSLVASGRSVRGQLDNDLDDDDNADGMSDPLVGLGGLVLLLVPLVGGSEFLLSLYELPMVGCEYYLPLERPG